MTTQPTTPKTLPELLACPFCSKPAPEDLSDTLYPNGLYWREEDGVRFYIGHYNEEDRQADDQRCWTMHCTQNMGGCGAQVSGDSREQAIAAWNHRPALAAQPPAVAANTKDAVFQASIDFIKELTGMEPPPIEVAPAEVFKPFHDFTNKVCALFDAPQPPAGLTGMRPGIADPDAAAIASQSGKGV